MLREKLTKNLDLAFFGGNLVSDSVKRNVSFVDAVRYSPLNVGFTTIFATSATLVFSVTFLLTDIVNEKFGRKETQKMIFIAFIT